MKKILQIIFKILLALFMMVSIAIFLISIFRPEWVKMAIVWMEEVIKIIGNWNYGIAFASALIESLPVIGSMVPGMNIMVLVGGFWGKTSTAAFLLTTMCAILGAMIGNFVGFWLWKKYGNHIMDNYGNMIGIGKTEKKILENQMQKNGFWYIVLGKFHGTLRAFVPFIAWANNMQNKNFWLYNSISSIIWAITINLIGLFFIQNYETILDNIGKILLGIFVAILAYFYFFQKQKLQKYWNDKMEEMNNDIKTKIWETRHENLHIRVENHIFLSGKNNEKIIINDMVVYEHHKNSALWFEKTFTIEDKRVTVKIWSKWHLFGVACQILVNDTRIFGDAIVLFSDKQ